MSDGGIEKTAVDYWEGLWAEAGAAPAAGTDGFRRTQVEVWFDELFARVLAGRGSGTRLLEIGCARSVWLPRFARRFGFDVSGIDYSPVGCAQTREMLDAAGVDGRVVCADFFSPPDWMRGSFDVVVSFGVVEHFNDAAAALSALADFLAAGGTMITIIPNVRGSIGLIQKLFNPVVLDLHVPLGPRELADAHRRAGLANARSGYFVSTNFGVVNLHGLDGRSLTTRVKSVISLGLARLSQVVWLVEQTSRIRLPARRAWAGYVVCVGDRPQGRE